MRLPASLVIKDKAVMAKNATQTAIPMIGPRSKLRRIVKNMGITISQTAAKIIKGR